MNLFLLCPSPVEGDTDSRAKPENDDGLRAATRIAAS
jgi:hypothetical protein